MTQKDYYDFREEGTSRQVSLEKLLRCAFRKWKIRCILIPGTGEGMPHVWNTVFWDEKWHESDPSWDTVSDEINSGQYFDLTTAEMGKDHEREETGIALLVPIAD